MKANTNLTQEVINKRFQQAEEMSSIWENSPKEVQAYLTGCIATAVALAGKCDNAKRAGQIFWVYVENFIGGDRDKRCINVKR